MSRSASYRAITIAMVVVAGVAVAFVLNRLTTDSLHRIMRAAADTRTRTIHTRLHGFQYKPFLRSRAGLQPRDPAALRLRSAVALARAELSSDRTDATSLHALGVALLLAGDTSDAVSALEEAARQDAQNDVYLSDLAAALYELGQEIDDPRLMARSVAAADAALALSPQSSEARFNRALALENLGVTRLAAAAYERTVEGLPHDEWTAEAESRLDFLRKRLGDTWTLAQSALREAAINGDEKSVSAIVARFPQESRSWSETVFLGRWGHAVTSDDDVAANRELLICRAVGTALQRLSGESLLRDAVAAIDLAISANDLAGLRTLARAHVAYDEGRNLYGHRDVQSARPLLARATGDFASVGSPMRLAAEHYSANAASDAGASLEAERTLDALLRRLPDKYAALRAQTLWQIGTLAAARNDPYFAADRYLAAADGFDALRESANAISVRSAAARMLVLLGRPSEAWRLRSVVLRTAASLDDEWSLQFILLSAGRDALSEDNADVARVFLTLAGDLVPPPKPRPNPRRHVDILIFAAVAAAQANDPEVATLLLDRARQSAVTLRSTEMRSDALNDVDVGEARITRSSNPRRALVLLDSALEYVLAHGRPVRAAELYSEQGRALRSLGQISAAATSLRNAVEVLEQRESAESTVRSMSFDPVRDVYGELTDLLEKQRNVAEALQIADRGRQLLLPRARAIPLTVRDVQRALPEATALLHYTVRSDSLIVITITADSAELSRISVERPRLTALIDKATSRKEGEALGTILLQSLGSEITTLRKLIVVPDTLLDRVPFAMLPNPVTGAKLVERTAVIISPSAAYYVERRARKNRQFESALVIGDPSFARSSLTELPRLPEAANEARDIAAMYPTSICLVGANATPAALLRDVGRCDVLHVASHAVTSPTDPRLAALLLAADENDDGTLRVQDIANSASPRLSLAVLAGCRTGYRGKGGSSLALAFLAAGASSVVGALWDIDDKSSHRFGVTFHRFIRNGFAPSEALRLAQLDMSRHAALNDTTWGAFQIYGSGE